MNPFSAIARGFKQFRMRFADRVYWLGGSAGRTRHDYQRAVGDGSGNSILKMVIRWICRTFPEAPIRVMTINTGGEDVDVPNHPLKMLLDSPNPFYSGRKLWAGTLSDLCLSGNAYWLKVRSSAGRVVELWWVPSSMIEPKWPDNGRVFISHYDYTPNGTAEPQQIQVSDVVHFRDIEFDPTNNRKGISPVYSLLRELYTDDEAAVYTASMLHNVGVPPVILSPTDPNAQPSPEELQATKQRYQDLTTGENRGQALVMTGATKVDRIGFNPSEMNVRDLRRIPEERISGIFGVPAIVAGLGAGLDRSTFSNMAEAREAAYESCIIPMQDALLDDLRVQLIPDFGDPQRLKMEFDRSQVRVLQEDQNALHARARDNLLAGGISLNEYRQEIGLDPLPGKDGDVFYIPGSVTPTDPTELIAEPELVPVPVLPAGAGEEGENIRRLPAAGESAA